MPKDAVMQPELPKLRGYRRLVQSLGAVVWRADPESFRFTFVSREAQRVLGYPVEHWTLRPEFWVERVHPDDRNAVRSALEACARQLRQQTFEYRMHAHDGRAVWLRAVATPLVEGGVLRELVGIMTDITDWKRLEEDRARFFSLSLHLLAIAGFDGVLRQVNPAWSKVLGWPQEYLLRRPYLQLVHPDERRRVGLELERLIARQRAVDFEARLATSSGGYRWMQVSAQALAEEKIVYVVATDVTERRRAEETRRLYEDQRRIANRLQRSFLPDKLPQMDGVQVGARFVAGAPDAEVGGDWYDVVVPDPDRPFFVVADVVGRGIRAATEMGQLRNALRAYFFEGHGAGAAVRQLNRLVFELEVGVCTTVVCAGLEVSTRRLRVVSAGHPPPIVCSETGVEFLDVESIPLGVLADSDYPESEEVLAPGSTVLMYTDGLIERRGETIEDGLHRLRDVVGAAPSEPQRMVDSVIQQLVEDAPKDDVAVLALAVMG